MSFLIKIKNIYAFCNSKRKLLTDIYKIYNVKKKILLQLLDKEKNYDFIALVAYLELHKNEFFYFDREFKKPTIFLLLKCIKTDNIFNLYLTQHRRNKKIIRFLWYEVFCNIKMEYKKLFPYITEKSIHRIGKIKDSLIEKK